MANVIVFRVDHDGHRALFSDVKDAEAYASKRKHGGQPARVQSFEIPAGSEKQWNVDATLPKKAAPTPPPEPRRTVREPEPDDDAEETPKRKQKRR